MGAKARPRCRSSCPILATDQYTPTGMLCQYSDIYVVKGWPKGEPLDPLPQLTNPNETDDIVDPLLRRAAWTKALGRKCSLDHRKTSGA
ncbi:unnamed protein product [Nesidiocoris tenuis]|uniref:Uncharacterized protein n=1 Tax=Nesidiocoris tenuis TaxID=355587 RepID=A0A6H5GML5_9HEMI|nr:unnamed protein product [Nesidiocoris tenuis]